MRNPLTRAISGDGGMNKTDIALNGYTNHIKLYNNYALRWLAGVADDDDWNKNITEDNYNKALKRLKKFEHVAIIEDLIETLNFMCVEWSWSKCKTKKKNINIHPRIIINNDTLIREFLDIYYYDIKLYEEAIKISINQLKEKLYKHDILNNFPTNYKEALLKELEIPIENLNRRLIEIPKWLEM